MNERPSWMRTLLSSVPSSEPANVVPMRKRSWTELERGIVEASAAFSRIIDEDDRNTTAWNAERERLADELSRINKAYGAERERIAGEAKQAAERVMQARRMFHEKCVESVRANANFIDEIVETELSGE